MGYLLTKYGVHHHLEGCQRVSESKEHDCWLEEPFGCKEGHFWFIPWFDAYVVVPPSDIEFCEKCASAQAVDSLENKGGNVAVPFGPFVYWSIILDRSEFPIFLLDKEEICGIGAPGFADRSSL